MRAAASRAPEVTNLSWLSQSTSHLRCRSTTAHGARSSRARTARRAPRSSRRVRTRRHRSTTTSAAWASARGRRRSSPPRRLRRSGMARVRARAHRIFPLPASIPPFSHSVSLASRSQGRPHAQELHDDFSWSLPRRLVQGAGRDRGEVQHVAHVQGQVELFSLCAHYLPPCERA